MTELEKNSVPVPSDAEIAASIAAETNQEILVEENSRESVIDRIKGFAGRVATALGQAEKDRPLDL